jgi:hypothetical protein
VSVRRQDVPIRVVRGSSAASGHGVPAILDTQSGSAVRARLAAETEGWDISKTFFRLGSEDARRPFGVRLSRAPLSQSDLLAALHSGAVSGG